MGIEAVVKTLLGHILHYCVARAVNRGERYIYLFRELLREGERVPSGTGIHQLPDLLLAVAGKIVELAAEVGHSTFIPAVLHQQVVCAAALELCFDIHTFFVVPHLPQIGFCIQSGSGTGIGTQSGVVPSLCIHIIDFPVFGLPVDSGRQSCR